MNATNELAGQPFGASPFGEAKSGSPPVVAEAPTGGGGIWLMQRQRKKRDEEDELQLAMALAYYLKAA